LATSTTPASTRRHSKDRSTATPEPDGNSRRRQLALTTTWLRELRGHAAQPARFKRPA
jgi:hypothetical protein